MLYFYHNSLLRNGDKKLKPFSNLLIDSTCPVKTAIELLEKAEQKTLFVVDDNGRLLAALTDGDIRRRLLKNGEINSTVADVANYYPLFLYDSERDKAQSLMAERHIWALPILDDDNVIIDVEFIFEKMDFSNMRIRRILPEDIDKINAFFDQMAGDTRSMFNRGDVNRDRINRHLEKNTDNEIHFGAFIDTANGEIIVGYVFLWDIDKTIPWLGIAVHEKCKGRHMGRELLRFIFDYSEENGYGGLMLTTVPANIRAQGLYERMGFEYQGIHSSGEYFYIKSFIKKIDGERL